MTAPVPSNGRTLGPTNARLHLCRWRTFSEATNESIKIRPFEGLASGRGTQFLEGRAFQTVEVAFSRSRLAKNVLRYFKPRHRLPNQEASIRNDLIQRLAHDS